MRAWLGLPFLAMLLGCPGHPYGPNSPPGTYEVQLAPTQILVRPGGTTQSLKAQLVQQPGNQVTSLTAWIDQGTFRWEIPNAPSGVDVGHFLLMESGTLREASKTGGLDGWGSLLQNYVPPTALPSGTTRLELMIRVTITLPNTLKVPTQAEIPLVLDVSAPALPPPMASAHEGNSVVEENRGPR